MEFDCKGSASEIYNKLKSRITEMRASGRLSVISDIQFEDSGQCALAKGTGFDAKLNCIDGKIKIELNLGFLLKPMRGKIEKELLNSLQKAMT